MSATESSDCGSIHFENVCPILRVENLEASIDYYVNKLAFKVNWYTANVMAGISRDRAHLMLCQGHQGHRGTWVWFGVGDVDALFCQYSASGAIIRLPPTNYPWAYEMHVQDPDGHVLRFGSEQKTDRPFAEWVEWYHDGN